MNAALLASGEPAVARALVDGLAASIVDATGDRLRVAAAGGGLVAH